MGFFKKDKGGKGKPQGGKRFGDKPFKKSGFGERRSGYGASGGSKQLFDAVCAECGRETQVPFRPTGTKPVLCRDCFRSEGDAPRPRRMGSDRGDARRTFDRGSSSSGGDSNTERRLNDLNRKMDHALEELSKITEMLNHFEVVDEEGEDEDSE